jgi:glycosyltransferase involved in cell wall biosynthesis
VEVILVDGHSCDGTREIAECYGARVLQYDPGAPVGTFDAPHRRNFGVTQARGTYVYYVDADMELEPGVIAEAVALIHDGCAAVIVPEDSIGDGLWARAKNLERRCYWGDDTVEAPRFFRADIWRRLGGLDETLGGGGDDWDMHEKLRAARYVTGRTRALVRHNEGRLNLMKLLRKRFMYGRDSAKYIAKRPKAGLVSYFPIRRAYLRNWRLFVARPRDAAAFVVMRFAEYAAGLAGIIFSSAAARKKS